VKSNSRPVSVSLVACVYLLVGALGFVRNIHVFQHPGLFWTELTEVLAVVAGAFMFLGRNWARWLALAWIAFHVLLSFDHPVLQTVIAHSVIFVLIAWLLFRPTSRRYFRAS
jgi:hypothetical protein